MLISKTEASNLKTYLLAWHACADWQSYRIFLLKGWLTIDFSYTDNMVSLTNLQSELRYIIHRICTVCIYRWFWGSSMLSRLSQLACTPLWCTKVTLQMTPYTSLVEVCISLNTFSRNRDNYCHDVLYMPWLLLVVLTEYELSIYT